jgi:ESCRT-II complex subunit VPS36
MSWTPFDCLPVAELTLSGLVVPLDQEVDLWTRQDVDLRGSDAGVPLDRNGQPEPTAGRIWANTVYNLTLRVTSHRLVFRNQHESRFVHLQNLVAASAESKFFTAPKLLLTTHLGDFTIIFKAGEATKDRDETLMHLHKAHKRQAWEDSVKLAQKQNAIKSQTARKVGVDAILAKNAIKHKEAAQVAQTAFEGDIENLLQEATELVGIIQKYVATLNRQEKSGDDQDASAEGANQLVDMLQDMGMTSALTKSHFRGSETAYVEELARQLADFVRPKLQKAGGIMTLTDVYCLYNRARGSNLISPDDMVKAVGMMNELKIGVSQRVFPSGLAVLQEDSLDDVTMAQKLLQLAEAHGSLTEMEASRECHMSLLIAHEQVLSAERGGYLCRDETLESVRFYPNRFAEWQR